jgi:hypothetical protein
MSNVSDIAVEIYRHAYERRIRMLFNATFTVVIIGMALVMTGFTTGITWLTRAAAIALHAALIALAALRIRLELRTRRRPAHMAWSDIDPTGRKLLKLEGILAAAFIVIAVSTTWERSDPLVPIFILGPIAGIALGAAIIVVSSWPLRTTIIKDTAPHSPQEDPGNTSASSINRAVEVTDQINAVNNVEKPGM